MVEIEKGIPMPVNRKPNIYPWKEMEIGDSFLFTGNAASAYSTTGNTNRVIHDRKFAARKMKDGTMRVWRIA